MAKNQNKLEHEQQIYMPVMNGKRAFFKGNERVLDSVRAEIEMKELQVTLLKLRTVFPEGYTELFANELKAILIHKELLPETAKSDEKVDRIIKDFMGEKTKTINPTSEEVKKQMVEMFLELGIDKDKMIERYPWAKEHLQNTVNDVNHYQNNKESQWDAAIEEALEAAEIPEPEFEMEM